jgi:hypothetical protein
VLEIGLRMVAERMWAAILTPLLVAIPFVTLVNYFEEVVFADKWARRVMTPIEDLLSAKYLPRGA